MAAGKGREVSLRDQEGSSTWLTFLSIGANRVGLVGLLNDRLPCLVRLSIRLGLGNHALNILVAETGRRGDGHGLILASGLIILISHAF